jgi:glycolate oxidase FAD binding subunit
MLVVPSADAEKLWFGLTEFQIASDDPLSFKANLLPSRTVELVRLAENAGCSVQARAGSGIVMGHLPDTVTSAAAARSLLEPLRDVARACRGNLVILQCDESWKTELPIFGDPEPAWPLMMRLKHELDPRNLLNPGRLL